MANVKKQKTAFAGNGPAEVARAVKEEKLGNLIPVRFLPVLVFLVAVLFYINSVGGTYVMDDAIVISENQFTIQGINGWKGIFGHDTFFGFFKESGKDHLLSGGRYRPLSLALFALEGQIFGFRPVVFHLFNLFYFAFTCFLLYHTVRKLLDGRFAGSSPALMAFFAALIFAVHPIHTEVVANIKGRDEILTCLLGLAGMWYFIRSFETGKYGGAIFASALWFMALLSKENGIIFIALAPLAVWFFKDASYARILKALIPGIIAVSAYLIIRYSVLGPSPRSGPVMELMNNPFLHWEVNGYLPVSPAVKLATIAVTLLRYAVLLIFPHPLTSDYYPQQIALVSWSDWEAILGLLVYAGAVITCIVRLPKKELPVYGVLFYLIALFPVSNILFPVGTLMSERFLFIPSIGFCLIVSWLIHSYIVKGSLKTGINLVLTAIILILGVKTIARNKDWSDNYTLFTTDVKVSSRSAKMLNSAGGVMVDSAARIQDPVVRKQMLDEAQGYLKKAIELHPSYSNAYLLLGNAFAYQNEFEPAMVNYEKALQYNPDFRDAKINLAIAYREVGKITGEKKGNLSGALNLLRKSLELNPKDPETNRLMGVATGISGDSKTALTYFKAALDADPGNAFYMFDLGSAYANTGDMQKANYYHAEAIRKDPSLQKRLNK